ncbi:hypothetical protein [Microvirga sp. P5_D2]
MGHDADDWPEGFLITIPHAWRDNGLWRDMQMEAQKQIGSGLRELYLDPLRQPPPPVLSKLVQEISGRRDTSAVQSAD